MILVIILVWVAPLCWGYIPPAAWVIGNMAKVSPVLNLGDNKFDASIDCRAIQAKYCSQKVREYLTSAGVDLSIISLGFFANEPVYIIGAKAGDEKPPQVWVDKEKFAIVK